MPRKKGSKPAEDEQPIATLQPKQVTPPKNTGGGGFVSENQTAALLLSCMLADVPPLEPTLGTIVRIDFQVRPDGWYLDDALLTLEYADIQHRLALSIKSNAQFDEHGAPDDFVETAWMQLLQEGSTVFNEAIDYLGLATSVLPQDIYTGLHALLQKAETEDPASLDQRIQVSGWANDVERLIYKSFAVPQALGNSEPATRPLPGRLLKRIRHLQFDSATQPSSAVGRAVQLCRDALHSGELAEADNLWSRLQTIADQYRPRAGSLTRVQLLDKLRLQFALKEVPHHQSDWERLREISRRSAEQVSDTIGQLVQLDRRADVALIDEELSRAAGVVLRGASGTGKSALARRWADAHTSLPGQAVLWFEAESLENNDFQGFEFHLGLRHPLSQILGIVASAHATLILDGLDRVNDRGVANAVVLLRMLELGRQGGPWRVIMTCQSEEWPRLSEALFRRGVEIDNWLPVDLAPLELKQLTPVWEGFPSTARLQFQPQLHQILTNLKLLDLICTKVAMRSQVDIPALVGESSIAEWFWTSVVQDGPEPTKRARFVQLLAELQPQKMRSTVPLDVLDTSQLDTFESLCADRICWKTQTDQIGFEHELYGDWARQRLLVTHTSDLPAYTRQRLQSPWWHRAVRLYGLHLLDQPDGPNRWQMALATFDAEGSVAANLLLESVIFAADPETHLERLYGTLTASDGLLLRRLLACFLHFATLPDPRVVDFVRREGGDETAAAAHYRIPYWPQWVPMLRFLSRHRQDVTSFVPVEAARVARLWLDNTSARTPLRTEAASLGLMVGEQALQASRQFHDPVLRAARWEAVHSTLMAEEHESDDV